MMNCQSFSFTSAILERSCLKKKGINFRAFNEDKRTDQIAIRVLSPGKPHLQGSDDQCVQVLAGEECLLALKRSENDAFELNLEDDGIGFLYR
jgi:hypothetical protein